MQEARGQWWCSALLGFWLSCWCCCPRSMAAPQRPLLCTPSSSRMEHQACWTCMPVRWSHDNSMWHFSFICALPFLLVHGLSSNFLFLPLSFPQSSLSSLGGLTLVLNSEKERITKEGWGLLKNVWSFYLHPLFSSCWWATAGMVFEIAGAVLALETAQCL